MVPMTPGVTAHTKTFQNLLSTSGNSIYNDDIRQFLAPRISSWFEDSRLYSQMLCAEEFITEFRRWVASSHLNKVVGLDSFSFAAVSLGVTQALDQFHYDILRSNRKLRIFRGEYPYNRDVHSFDYSKDFIDDRPLEKNDALILSCPFSANGGIHPLMNATLNRCLELKVPVFIDLAWFGTCGHLEIDLSHPAITHAAFSLTKGLTCGNYRSGVRFSREAPKQQKPIDRLQLQHEWNHSVHLNLRIGLELMKYFDPDTQYRKYRSAQEFICNQLGLTPSPCVHIATTLDNNKKEFDRDNFCYRVNLRDAIKKYFSLNLSI